MQEQVLDDAEWVSGAWAVLRLQLLHRSAPHLCYLAKLLLDAPGYVKVLGLLALIRLYVIRIQVSRLLLAAGHVGRCCCASDIGRYAVDTVDDYRIRLDADVCVGPDVLLVALTDLMHLGAVAALIIVSTVGATRLALKPTDWERHTPVRPGPSACNAAAAITPQWGAGLAVAGLVIKALLAGDGAVKNASIHQQEPSLHNLCSDRLTNAADRHLLFPTTSEGVAARLQAVPLRHPR